MDCSLWKWAAKSEIGNGIGSNITLSFLWRWNFREFFFLKFVFRTQNYTALHHGTVLMLTFKKKFINRLKAKFGSKRIDRKTDWQTSQDIFGNKIIIGVGLQWASLLWKLNFLCSFQPKCTPWTAPLINLQCWNGSVWVNFFCSFFKRQDKLGNTPKFTRTFKHFRCCAQDKLPSNFLLMMPF